jgi:hypothetical protein
MHVPMTKPRVLLRIAGVAFRETVLRPERNVVGRSAGSDVFVDDPGTSREHCELWLMEDRLVVRDLGAINGTHLDGRRIQESVVGPGQILRVGEVELEFRDTPFRVVIPEAPAAEPPPTSRTLPDGSPSCGVHLDLPAFFHCPQCASHWCGDCVRVVGRKGGRRHAFCPGCNALCAFLPEVAKRHRTAGGLAGRLGRMSRGFLTWLTSGP